MPKPPEEEIRDAPKVALDDKPSKKRGGKVTVRKGKYLQIGKPDVRARVGRVIFGRDEIPGAVSPKKRVSGSVTPNLRRRQTGLDGAADENDIFSEIDLETALSHFRKRQQALERDHMNQYVAIDIDTGRMAIAASHSEAVDAYEVKYGTARTLTFHIGTTN